MRRVRRAYSLIKVDRSARTQTCRTRQTWQRQSPGTDTPDARVMDADMREAGIMDANRHDSGIRVSGVCRPHGTDAAETERFHASGVSGIGAVRADTYLFLTSTLGSKKEETHLSTISPTLRQKN